jgi:hypothetical protein
MAELDTIIVKNPLKEDFNVRFNGEPYTVKAGEEKTFPSFLAFHFAKHLSDKILSKEVEKIKKAKSDNPYRPEVGQLLLHDNVKRRMALYDVLRDKELVGHVIVAFNFKGLIGEMKEYEEYVDKIENPPAPKSSEKGK